MANKLTWKALGSLGAMTLFFIVLIASLYVLATTAERLDQFGGYYHWLLLINCIAIAFLAIVIGINGWRLIDEFRRQVAGSRLTLRLVLMSIFLALVPVTLVYAFSIKFLLSNINNWYDLEIEQALDDALELSRDSLGVQMRTLQRVTNSVAEQLAGVSESSLVVALNTLGANTDASELTLFDPNNRILASTGFTERLSVQPNRPDDDLAERARQGISYVGVDPVGDSDLYIRVVTPVLSASPTGEHIVLQALFPIAKRSEKLAQSVQSSYQQYRQLVFLRKPLKISSIVTLSLALLLSVLMAVWFALYAARRMMVPIHDLVEGTRHVAQGDYSTRIYKRGKDELGFLVQSFNYMTLQLEHSRDTAERTKSQIEQQRAYLETVLGRISSGVITLDNTGRVLTVNAAAVAILSQDSENFEGSYLENAVGNSDVMGQFCSQVVPHLNIDTQMQESENEWSSELEVMDTQGRRFLFCRGATLYGGDDIRTGTVLVIDDMTTILSAQRDAAWGEVARRLAHEIKNPLTPIQLSAERLRHKVMDKLEDKDAAVLNRLTTTIEQQVDAMKKMVNAFAEYASTPNLIFAKTDLNLLISEVVELYGDADERVLIELALDEHLPLVPIDDSRIRQLVHNLIKNSMEAQNQSAAKHMKILTRGVQYKKNRVLELVMQDNGPGFPVEIISRLFEPYVTSKSKGTGLGLAIVKKIVEEHSGSVVAENRIGQGARVIVRLPVPANVIQMRGDAA